MTEENLKKANELNEKLSGLRKQVDYLRDKFEAEAIRVLAPAVVSAMKDAGLGVAEVELDAAQDEFNNL